MELLERVRTLEAENRLLRGGLAAIVNVCEGGDEGGDMSLERTRGSVSSLHKAPRSPSVLTILAACLCLFVPVRVS